jgi:large subunit ribosomal protein L4
MKAKVTTFANKSAGDIDLDETVFGLPSRKDILARVVNWQLAKRRAGTHKTKGISEIRGTTAKPFNQKGTGRARQGSRRAAQMRGGATIFGPVVRSHAHSLTKKFRKLGLRTALSTKQLSGNLVIVDEAKLKAPKTSDLVKSLGKQDWGTVLVIDGSEVDSNFATAATNIPNFDVLPEQGANVYDILRRDTLVLTKAAVEMLEARLK